MFTIESSNIIYTFKNNMVPVHKIKLSQVFKVKTNDCFYQQITREDQILQEIDYSMINPATGPFPQRYILCY